MNSLDLYQMIHGLRNTPGRNDKIDGLKNILTDPFIREIFRVTYDPSLNYYLTTDRLEDILHLPDGDCKFGDDVFRLLEKMRNRDCLVADVRSYMQDFDSSAKEMFLSIINRSFDIGLNVSSINKACPGLIAVTPYMRCSTEKEVDIYGLNWVSGVYGQKKMDGEFLIMKQDGHSFQFITRAGSIFPAGSLDSLIPKDVKWASHEIHGELLLIDDAGAIVKRHTSNGVLNSLLQGGNLPPNYNLLFVAWDLVDLVEIQDKKGTTPYYERFSKLARAILDCPRIKLVENKMLMSPMDAFALRDYELAHGGEGIVIKESLGVWKDGVSKHVIKMKGTFVNSLRIVGFTEGKGKFSGLIGALSCVSEDALLHVNVSGFDVATREAITANQDKWMYQVVDVQHGGITSINEKTNLFSLIEPRLLNNCYRIDGCDADILNKIRLT